MCVLMYGVVYVQYVQCVCTWNHGTQPRQVLILIMIMMLIYDVRAGVRRSQSVSLLAV